MLESGRAWQALSDAALLIQQRGGDAVNLGFDRVPGSAPHTLFLLSAVFRATRQRAEQLLADALAAAEAGGWRAFGRLEDEAAKEKKGLDTHEHELLIMALVDVPEPETV